GAYQSAASAGNAAKNKQLADQIQQAQSSTKSQAEDKKLREACRGFEEMFLNLMYSKMRDTVPKDTLLGESNGQQIMQSMLDEQLTKEMAKAGGVGLADMLYKQLSIGKK
ncbi:MAG: rod-binding protein, partial [Selenomonadaceae bacterium]